MTAEERREVSDRILGEARGLTEMFRAGAMTERERNKEATVEENPGDLRK